MITSTKNKKEEKIITNLKKRIVIHTNRFTKSGWLFQKHLSRKNRQLKRSNWLYQTNNHSHHWRMFRKHDRKGIAKLSTHKRLLRI